MGRRLFGRRNQQLEPPCLEGEEDYVLDAGDGIGGSYSVAARKLLDRSEVAMRQETLEWAVIRPEMVSILADRLGMLDRNGTAARSVATNWDMCASSGRKKNDQRRKASLKLMKMPDGRSYSFTYEARERIPYQLLDKMSELNKADIRLFELAKGLL